MTSSRPTTQHGVPRFTNHARDRWAERTPVPNPTPIEDAWRETYPVGAPTVDATAVHLHPEYDVLLVVKNGDVTTVLEAKYGRLDTSGLIRCDGCDCFTDIATTGLTCPWCEAPLCGIRGDGQLAIRRTGGQ